MEVASCVGRAPIPLAHNVRAKSEVEPLMKLSRAYPSCWSSPSLDSFRCTTRDQRRTVYRVWLWRLPCRWVNTAGVIRGR
jgi:hypothetical protein